MNIPNASKEQSDIIESIKDGNSIYVDAVAGSGKTTTICHIGLSLSDKKILALTYNTHLRQETKAKINVLKLENVCIHTYHSLCNKNYPGKCYDDFHMKRIISKNEELITKCVYDLLIIDETQDMTPLYYNIIKKFISDINFNGQMMILGDKNQGIYDFKDADVRFLTLSNQLYNNMKSMTLKESFRLTKQMTWFVNNVMLNENRIISNKDGPKVKYIISNPFHAAKYIFTEIKRLLSQGYKYDDIFIITPSIRKKGDKETPIHRLENELVKNNIPCYVPTNGPLTESSKIDDDIIKNKIIFTTIHQSKGRERKIVILFSFDHSYFVYYNKDANPNICPPALYVAATRASKLLYLIEDPVQDKFHFMKKNEDDPEYAENVEVIHLKSLKKEKKAFNFKKEYKDIIIDTFSKFIKQDILNYINDNTEKLFKSVTLEKDIIEIDIINKVGHNNTYEDVSDINIVACICKWQTEIIQKQTSVIIEKSYYDTAYMNYINKINFNEPKVKDYLMIANLESSKLNGYMFKINQIKSYEWMSENIMNECLKTLNTNIINNDMEIKLFENFKEGKNDYVTDSCNINSIMFEIRFYGYMHVISQNNKNEFAYNEKESIWEIVCCDIIKIETYIKVMLKYYIWNMILLDKNLVTKKKFYILNIQNGEKIELSDQYDYLIEDIIKLIIQTKYGKIDRISNTEFLSRHKK